MALLKDRKNIGFQNALLDDNAIFCLQLHKHSFLVKKNCLRDVQAILVVVEVQLENAFKNIYSFNFGLLSAVFEIQCMLINLVHFIPESLVKRLGGFPFIFAGRHRLLYGSFGKTTGTLKHRRSNRGGTISLETLLKQMKHLHNFIPFFLGIAPTLDLIYLFLQL